MRDYKKICYEKEFKLDPKVTETIRHRIKQYIAENQLEDNPMKMSKVMKYIRRAYGLSQYQFSHVLGLKQARISNIETFRYCSKGTCPTTAQTYAKILNSQGINIDYEDLVPLNYVYDPYKTKGEIYGKRRNYV